jgi:hypothetical protein
MSTTPSTDPRAQAGAVDATHEGHQGSPDAISAALSDVSARVQTLVQQEIELAKAEITAKVRKLVQGAVIAAAAATFVVGALILFLHGLAWLAYWALPFPGGTVFWGFFVVAAILLLLAALAGFLASRAFKKMSPPAPTLAIDEAKRIKETVTSPHPETTIPAEARR